MTVLWKQTVLDVRHFPSLAHVRLPNGDAARCCPLELDVDGLTVRLHPVERESPSSRGGRTFDALFFQTLVGAITAHTLLMTLAHMTPGDDEPAMSWNDQRFRRAVTAPALKPPPKIASPRRAAPPPPGSAGTRPSQVTQARRSTGGARTVDARRRDLDRQAAINMVKSITGGSGAMARVFGSGSLDEGINLALGNMTNGSSADAHGARGTSTRGVGPGGGGDGTLNIGQLGGDPRGTGPGFELGARGKRPTVDTRCTNCRIQGGLEKAEIARVIRNHISQFKYCYEKELVRSPNLNGKVDVSFIINGQGRVTQVDVVDSTLGDQTVEDCVARIMLRMMFPAPRGGGIVEVNYPFIFQNAG